MPIDPVFISVRMTLAVDNRYYELASGGEYYELASGGEFSGH
jgi:hypothetical protein